MRDLCKRLGIQPKLSTAFHPQTDGQTERMNRDLQQYLWLFTAEKQDEWVDWLPIAQFSYNTKKQASTQKSPFEVTRSYVP
jgi:transposase InsO family protein